MVAAYVTVGASLAGWLGTQGARIRAHYFPFSPMKQEMSRSELLELLVALQHRLEGQKEHRAFLSVDVVASSDVKRTAPELAVEYSFGQLQRWIEEVARECDGEMRAWQEMA